MDYNAIDNGEINSFLAGCCDHPATASLLSVCLEKALRKGPDGLKVLNEPASDAPAWLRDKFSAGVAFHHFVPDAALEQRVRHVADWIEAARVNNEPWLQNCDRKGRPLKLLKIGSLAQAEAEADKAMRRFAFAAAAAPHIDGEGEESVMTFADGSRIVRLLTPAALDRESATMGHCVGNGDYDERGRNRSRILYSLRDRGNKAHVTFYVKVQGNELVQCKGKQNAPPVARYMPQVRGFIERSGFVLKESARMTGLVQDVTGRIHNIRDMPEGLRLGHGLDLRGTGITALPGGLSVGGSLYLYGTAITALPEALCVGGSLDLRGTAIAALPQALSVGGSLHLFGTFLTALPDGLSVGGDLDLRGTGITALPDRLSVGGGLDLSGTAITALPEGLSVGDWLDLRDTAITALPDKLSVGGGLDLRNTGITALPDRLSVRGDLHLCGTGITALPEGFSVGGGLDLRGTAITALPKGLSVGGGLDLRDTAITALPDGLVVGHDLYLEDTAITALPDGLSVGGRLHLNGTGIIALPHRLHVGGEILGLRPTLKRGFAHLLKFVLGP